MINLFAESTPVSAIREQFEETPHYLREELFERLGSDLGLFGWLDQSCWDGLWYWDLEQPENEWLSPGLRALLGFGDEDVPHHSSWKQQRIHAEDWELVSANLRAHIQQGAPFDQEVRYQHKDGSTVWVRCRVLVFRDEAGTPTRLLGVNSDVTEQMRVRGLLDERQRVYDMLCNEVLSGFWDWDMRTGEDFLSSRWKSSLGYADGELLNRVESWERLLHPEDRAVAYAAVRAHLDEGKPFSQVLRYFKKDGSMAWMLSQGVANRGADGHWYKMCGVNVDVTELKQAEHQLQRRTEQLERHNEDLTHFARVVSHDLNSPLRGAVGIAELLRGEVEGLKIGKEKTSQILEYSKLIEESCGRALNMITQLRAYIRHAQDKAPRLPTDIDTLVADVIRVLPGDIKAQAQIKIPKRLPEVRVNAALMLSVFQNLIENALKYSGDQPANVVISAKRLSNEWEFSVKDRGVGIPEALHERVFDVFARVGQSKAEGLGMGLALAARGVKAHNGKIWVESKPGAGSNFRFTLPDEQPVDQP